MPILVIISKSYKLIQASITKSPDKLQKKFVVPHFWDKKVTKYKYFLDWFFFFFIFWGFWSLRIGYDDSSISTCKFLEFEVVLFDGLSHISLSASHFTSVAYILFQIVRKHWCMSLVEPGKYSCSNRYLPLFLKVTPPLLNKIPLLYYFFPIIAPLSKTYNCMNRFLMTYISNPHTVWWKPHECTLTTAVSACCLLQNRLSINYHISVNEY